MLKVTAEEQALVDLDAKLRVQVQEKTGEMRRLTNSYDPDTAAQRNAIQAEIDAAKEEIAALVKSPIALRYKIKMEFNTALARNLPGGETAALVDVAKEVLEWLVTDESMVGGAEVLKAVVILGFDKFNDPDIHAARARGVVARYKALLAEGLPDTLVQNILVAEAGRAFPTFSSKLKG
jgi:hypothetical protein